MTAVWKLDLPPSDKMVLLALADAANDDGVTWMAVKSKTAGKLDLLKKCSLSLRAVQGALKRLCEGGYLTRLDRTGKGVIWTVTPAADAPRQDMRPAANASGTAADAPKPSSNRQSKKTKEREGAPSKRCPADWSPSPDDLETAEAEGLPPGQVERELAKFRDHTFGTARVDWSATFRNWIRQAAERAPRNDRHPSRQADRSESRSVWTDIIAESDGPRSGPVQPLRLAG